MTTDTDHDADTSADQPDDRPTTRSGRSAEAARAAARPRSTGAAGTTADRRTPLAPRRAPEPATRAAATRSTPAAPGAASSRLPWILAVLGLVGTVAFASLWLTGRGEDGGGGDPASATVEVKEAAERFATSLTNFDGATIDADVDEIVAQSTGDFRDEVDQFFGSDTRVQLKEASASSRGEIRSSYVQTVEGDRGTAFVVLDQTIANNRSPQPKADTLRMEVALRLVDGAWLVQRVNVLDAPSGTYSGAADAGADAPTTTAPAGATTTVPGG